MFGVSYSEVAYCEDAIDGGVCSDACLSFELDGVEGEEGAMLVLDDIVLM